jgi:hypothetical protein
MPNERKKMVDGDVYISVIASLVSIVMALAERF